MYMCLCICVYVYVSVHMCLCICVYAYVSMYIVSEECLTSSRSTLRSVHEPKIGPWSMVRGPWSVQAVGVAETGGRCTHT